MESIMKSFLAPMIFGMGLLMSSTAYAGDDSANGVYQSGLAQDQQAGSGETIIEDVYDSITEYDNVTEKIITKTYDLSYDYPTYGFFCGVERYENSIFKELITCDGLVGLKGHLKCPFSYKKIETTPDIHICQYVECNPFRDGYTEDNAEYCVARLPSDIVYYNSYRDLFEIFQIDGTYDTCEDIGLVTKELWGTLVCDRE